ncbi:GNAT family N-acetyltransferase [Aquincola tertiaricarbonis]|uniref:GNAT family N-acetyltransferase n=1 Tax=Aquincola tertiaricarbonis TaxID=391953 RepID=UPI00061506BF|nr:GNAT family N-acetyltransferase [Aquincola tertiaricarbonis]
MPLTWTTDPGPVDWQEAEHLYRVAPLGNKSAEHLRTVFNNSRFTFFAHDEGCLVAAGRVLSDGADCAYLCDVAVMPSHQGTGLGREMMERLLEACRGHKKVILYAVPGKEDFYRRFGFRSLLTAMAIFEDEAGAVARGHLGQ